MSSARAAGSLRTPTGRLASLSTRNGGEAYHWQSLGGVSAKVASSALETHGRIDQLMAGESGRPCGEILSASDLATVRAAFVRVLGEEVVRQRQQRAAAAVGPAAAAAAASI